MTKEFHRQSRGLFAAVALCLAASIPTTAFASRVSPMIVEMTPDGRSSVGRVELTNDSDREIAYEVQMMRGEISPTGELVLDPADAEFIVFPPQALVEANSQQVFRIQYVGDEALENSQLYYLAIRQVPVAFDEGRNQVQVVVNYNVLVNVVPDGTRPEPVIRSAIYGERPQPTQDLADEEIPEVVPTENGLLVNLGNDGSRYFMAGRADWKITALTISGEPFEMNLTASEVAKLTGVGVIGPGRTRQFFIPIDQPLVSESINVSLEL